MNDSVTLQELSDLASGCPVYDLPRLIEILRGDPRPGARKVAQRAWRRWVQAFDLWNAFQRGFHYERDLWRQGYRYVAGVDEVGRGPLAGPVIAAAVILDPRSNIPGLFDSKALTTSMRERLAADLLRGKAVAVSIGAASVAEINRLNIFHAAQLAMLRAVERLRPQPDFLLVDGRPLRNTSIPQRALVGGDRLSNSIAAASIVAKVYRDRLMVHLDRLFPGYGFARHKGYPTSEHRDALVALGPSPLHRHRFRLLG